ncbi:MAG TPA: PAS domain S-box protein [Candidatus Thermoplasmatota archaeon]|nr:PAS domain S-box protein [Candidatus Thermoplasmatota archaeon]
MIVILGVDDTLHAGLAASQRRLGRGPPLHCRTEADLMDAIDHAPPDLNAVLLGEAVEEPLEVARRVKAVRPDLPILVLGTGATLPWLEHSLLLTPLPGEPVRAIPAGDGSVRAIEAHLARFRLQAHQRTVLAALDAKLAEPQAAAPRPPEFQHHILEVAPIGIVLLDPAGRIVRASRAARHTFGLPAEGTGAPRFLDLFPEEERPRLATLLQQADATAVLRVKRPGSDGAAQVFDVLASPVMLMPLRPGAMVVLQDVTDLVRSHEALRAQTTRYETLLRAQSDLGEGILLVERDQVIYANDAAGHLVGRSAEALHGLTIYDFIAPQDLERVRALHERRVRGEPVETFLELQFRHQAGHTFPVEVSVRTLPGRPVPTFVAILRDVTARKEAERALEQARLELARGEKLAALGGLVGGLAHEIRTPLTVLSNHLAILRVTLRQAGEDPAVAALAGRLLPHLEASEENVARINHLVRDLRRFIQAKRGPLERGDLSRPVAEAVRLFQQAFQGAITIHEHLEARGTVERDPLQVQQLVLNFLQNAVEAAPGGVTVTVATRDLPGCVEVEVADDGPGIAPEVAERMFEPFVTTKPDGTGLGLSIIRRIVEGHNATLDYDTAPDKGTRFRVRFPAPPPA